MSGTVFRLVAFISAAALGGAGLLFTYRKGKRNRIINSVDLSKNVEELTQTECVQQLNTYASRASGTRARGITGGYHHPYPDLNDRLCREAASGDVKAALAVTLLDESVDAMYSVDCNAAALSPDEVGRCNEVRSRLQSFCFINDQFASLLNQADKIPPSK